MDLFDAEENSTGKKGTKVSIMNAKGVIDPPLAYRMSPRSLEEYVGQEHIIGEGKLLRRAIEADRVTSIILYGPPGTGKTALARVVANMTRSAFYWLNAATVGLDELRKVIKKARGGTAPREKEGTAPRDFGGTAPGVTGIKTILFLDEIHRFNKLQQDALLPDVEEGTLTLIAATVENPFFYVNSALLSRSQVFELKALSREALITLLRRAVIDRERGLGGMDISITEDALDHLAKMADGDARRALSALEVAALTTRPISLGTVVPGRSETGMEGKIVITKAIAEESVQKKAVVYDKQGDQHYDTISAFIKSMRGGDPDAAVYWLAKMIYAGEDPRFIARRIVICASEDVGDADPMALVLATSALKAVEFVGMPEGRIPLSQAAIYVARAPKSNACYMAIEAALKDVASEETEAVPLHLKDANYAGAKELGRGEGYIYTHDHPDKEQDFTRRKKKYYKTDKSSGEKEG